MPPVKLPKKRGTVEIKWEQFHTSAQATILHIEYVYYHISQEQ